MTRLTIYTGDEPPLTPDVTTLDVDEMRDKVARSDVTTLDVDEMRDKVARSVDDGLALVLTGPHGAVVVNPAHIRFAVVTP